MRRTAASPPGVPAICVTPWRAPTPCTARAGRRHRGPAGGRADRGGAGVIGQETTGAGGIAFALRTVPAVTTIAETVADVAPDALFINFTNPAGLVTEAIGRVLGDRVGRHLRRAARPVRAGRRGDRPARRRALVRLLRHQPPGLAAQRPPPRSRPAAGAARRRRAAGLVRGGAAVRRRVAAGGRDGAQRVPLLLLRRARGAGPMRSDELRAAYLLDRQRAFYEGNGDALASGGPPPPSARRRTWPKRGPPAASTWP